MNLVEIAREFSSPRYARNSAVLAAIAHHATSLNLRQPIKLLDITADPSIEINVWRSYFANADISAVLAKSLNTWKSEVPSATIASHSFGSAFWNEVAMTVDPSLILSDGTLGHYHQKELFEYLFPVLEPGGIFVIEFDPKDTNHVLLDFLRKIVDARIDSDEELKKNSDFLGYCIRNMEAIEFLNRAVILRKRSFDQLKFLAQPLKEIAEESWSLDSPSAYPRTTPRIFGSLSIEQRTFTLIENFKEQAPPVAQVGKLKNAIITDGGIVYTSDGRIVEESFINVSNVSRRGPFFRVGKGNLYVSESAVEPKDSLSGEERVIVKQTWDSNYGHWIVDTFPRVFNVLEEFENRQYRYILNGSAKPEIKKLHSASLELLEIDEDSIDFVDRRPTLIENAIYATPMTKPPFLKSPLAISKLEELARKVVVRTSSIHPRASSKIYLTRNKYPRRKLLNEDAILPYIEQAGYKIVVPEELSLQEQILTFASATHVIGNMGAAFSSLAFSPKGVNVFMLATEHMLHDFFLDIVSHKHGQYWALQGTAKEPGTNIGSDFTVDLEMFKEVFDEFIQL